MSQRQPPSQPPALPKVVFVLLRFTIGDDRAENRGISPFLPSPGLEARGLKHDRLLRSYTTDRQMCAMYVLATPQLKQVHVRNIR